ncbi:hypothetical protein ACFL35_18275, partial [Candidatus Riflebacteria bacterium]
MDEFKIISEIKNTELITEGRGIRELDRLKKNYGGRNWKKMKGEATVELNDGNVYLAEIHWNECHGVGKKE